MPSLNFPARLSPGRRAYTLKAPRSDAWALAIPSPLPLSLELVCVSTSVSTSDPTQLRKDPPTAPPPTPRSLVCVSFFVSSSPLTGRGVRDPRPDPPPVNQVGGENLSGLATRRGRWLSCGERLSYLRGLGLAPQLYRVNFESSAARPCSARLSLCLEKD